MKTPRNTELKETMKTPRNTELGDTMKTPRNTKLGEAMKTPRNKGRPVVDGLLPVGWCWFLGCISGLPAGSLPGQSVEILLAMVIPLEA
jgi:hypothetical protein